MGQGFGFDPWLGHMQQSANECIHEWNNKSISPSLSLSLSPCLPSLSLSHPLPLKSILKKPGSTIPPPAHLGPNRRAAEGTNSHHNSSLAVCPLDQKHYWKSNIKCMHHLPIIESIHSAFYLFPRKPIHVLYILSNLYSKALRH